MKCCRAVAPLKGGAIRSSAYPSSMIRTGDMYTPECCGDCSEEYTYHLFESSKYIIERNGLHPPIRGCDRPTMFFTVVVRHHVPGHETCTPGSVTALSRVPIFCCGLGTPFCTKRIFLDDSFQGACFVGLKRSVSPIRVYSRSTNPF